jgi:hypothetical protein
MELMMRPPPKTEAEALAFRAEIGAFAIEAKTMSETRASVSSRPSPTRRGRRSSRARALRADEVIDLTKV